MNVHDGSQRVKFGDVVRNVSESVADPVSVGLERAVGLDHLDPNELAVTRWALTGDGLTFTRRFRAGQVLFGRRRAYQRKVAFPDFDGVCSGDIYVLEPRDERLIKRLLPFIVQSEPFLRYALRTSAGSLSPRTKWSDLQNYEFDLPPLDEQREVAALLWSMEAALDRYRDTEAAASRLLVALSLEAFPGRGSRPILALSDVCEAIIDCEHKTAPSGEGSARVVGTPDVRDGVINLSTARTVSDRTFAEWTSRATPTHGDLILTREAPVGEVGEVPDKSRVCLGQRTVLIRPDRTVVYPKFLHLCLMSREVQASMMRIAAGTTTPHLNVADIKSLKIPQPLSLNEQEAVVAKAVEVNRLLSLIAAQSAAMASLKMQAIKSYLAGR